MALLKSLTKITFNSVVILAYGDSLVGEIETDQQVDGDDVTYVRAAHAVPLARGGRVNTLRFAYLKAHASIAAAMADRVDYASSLAASGALVVETTSTPGGSTVLTRSYAAARLVQASSRVWENALYTVRSVTLHHGVVT